MIATSQAATDTIDYVVSDEFGNITTTTRRLRAGGDFNNTNSGVAEWR